jgi:hypothetical protein
MHARRFWIIVPILAMQRIDSDRAMDIEALRRSYRPGKVRLLLVGESAPASGNHFYRGDDLTTATSSAFAKAYGRTFANHTEFLERFKTLGCYLDDLCPTSVNDMPVKEREWIAKASVPSFSLRLREMAPEVVVSVLRRITPYVHDAVTRAGGRRPSFDTLPYPTYH